MDKYSNSIPDSQKGDPVNHPAHYTAASIEVIDFLEAWNLPFHLANAIKYICRAGRKDKNKTVEDLRKAVWYVNRYIDYLSKEGKHDTDRKLSP